MISAQRKTRQTHRGDLRVESMCGEERLAHLPSSTHVVLERRHRAEEGALAIMMWCSRELKLRGITGNKRCSFCVATARTMEGFSFLAPPIRPCEMTNLIPSQNQIKIRSQVLCDSLAGLNYGKIQRTREKIKIDKVSPRCTLKASAARRKNWDLFFRQHKMTQWKIVAPLLFDVHTHIMTSIFSKRA